MQTDAFKWGFHGMQHYAELRSESMSIYFPLENMGGKWYIYEIEIAAEYPLQGSKGHPLFVMTMEDHLATFMCEKLLILFLLIIYWLEIALHLFVMNGGNTVRNEEENINH